MLLSLITLGLNFIVFLTGVPPILGRINDRCPKIDQDSAHYGRIVLYILLSLITLFGLLRTQSQLTKLTQAIEAPSLTAKDEKVFLDVLRKEAPGKVSIFWTNGNPDTEAFAQQLHERLLDARWESQLVFGSDTTLGTSHGLGIFVATSGATPPMQKHFK